MKFQQGEAYFQFKVGRATFSFTAHESGGDVWLVNNPKVGSVMEW